MPTTETRPRLFGNQRSETIIAKDHELRLKAFSLKRNFQEVLLNLPQFNIAARNPILEEEQSSIKFTIGEKVWEVKREIFSRRFCVSWELKNEHNAKRYSKEQILKKEVSIVNLASVWGSTASAVMITLSRDPYASSDGRQDYYNTRYLTDNAAALKEAGLILEELRSLAPSVKKG